MGDALLVFIILGLAIGLVILHIRVSDLEHSLTQHLEREHHIQRDNWRH